MRNFSSRSDDWKGWLGIGAITVAVGLLITWVIMEFVCTRSFTGELVGKNADVSYSHDERRMVISEDKDGHRSTSYRGTDRTTAYRTYNLVFFVEGQMREVSAGKNSASVPYVRSDTMALHKLDSESTEPAFYTHGQLNHQYLVKVRGWLFDGRIVEMTDLITIKAE